MFVGGSTVYSGHTDLQTVLQIFLALCIVRHGSVLVMLRPGMAIMHTVAN